MKREIELCTHVACVNEINFWKSLYSLPKVCTVPLGGRMGLKDCMRIDGVVHSCGRMGEVVLAGPPSISKNANASVGLVCLPYSNPD